MRVVIFEACQHWKLLCKKFNQVKSVQSQRSSSVCPFLCGINMQCFRNKKVISWLSKYAAVCEEMILNTLLLKRFFSVQHLIGMCFYYPTRLTRPRKRGLQPQQLTWAIFSSGFDIASHMSKQSAPPIPPPSISRVTPLPPGAAHCSCQTGP